MTCYQVNAVDTDRAILDGGGGHVYFHPMVIPQDYMPKGNNGSNMI